MKHLKVTSALLSAVMCMSMVATPVAVMADETSAPEETQAARNLGHGHVPAAPAGHRRRGRHIRTGR